MLVTKQMLGNQTLKSILYLDQNFFSSVQRGGAANEWATVPMAKVKELLDLQLLAIPYSFTHVAEADLNGEYRDALVQFIQGVARGHHFEPYWRVEEIQILKAFHAYLENAAATYQKEERDALCPSVHDWDGDYSVSVFSAARDVDRRSMHKQQALDELLKVLPQWANKARTFEDDMELEINDTARVLIDSYTTKTARLMTGDFSALIDSPVRASVVEDMWRVVKAEGMDPAVIGGFFRAQHFTEVPTVQLSARLFSAYRQSLRSSWTKPDPTSRKTRDKLSGFFSDIEHAATYAPYCDGYFTDKAMARLMNDQRVRVEQDFGCKVFSVENMDAFLGWLEDVKSRMTPEHADDLRWAYPKRFPLNGN
ncbi:MAG TPA: hypothetical protein VLN48_08080 [Bryobacteraceae bacterium]|nr:hypothetical protein [Bryobacteraceae bacterium]